jgi:hypothetical protein
MKSKHVPIPPTLENCIRGGHIQGLENVKSGHLDQIRPKAMHARWHLKFGPPRSWCKFCMEGE